MSELPVAVRKAPLIVGSIIIMIVAAVNGIDAWWFWLMISAGLVAQILLAFGLGEEKEYWHEGRRVHGFDDDGNPIPFRLGRN